MRANICIDGPRAKGDFCVRRRVYAVTRNAIAFVRRYRSTALVRWNIGLPLGAVRIELPGDVVGSGAVGIRVWRRRVDFLNSLLNER